MRLAQWAIHLPAAVVIASVALLNPAAAKDAEPDRGTYLMNGIVACGNCHTPKGPDGRAIADQELSGGLVIDTPAFHAVVPNITPDPDTGIGKWTDQQIIDAIRNGKRPDGSTIGPPMPIEFYRHMSDTDARAIVAYLRSVKAISNKAGKSTFNVPLPDAYGLPVTHVADVAKQNHIAYGHYLADIGHCLECHTPREKGQLVMSKAGAGGQELPAGPTGTVLSANLTPANPQGMARWTNAQVKETIATGVRPDGHKLVRLMAFDWYNNIDNSDLDALIAYLRTLKAAKP
jgi:mono/diheme cytochrome c family protein